MKLMDEKGRLFGKINLFDLLVLALLAVGVIGMATRLIHSIGGSTETTTATYHLEIVGAREYLKTAYQVGDPLYEGDDFLGTITAVSVHPTEELKLMPDGTAKMVEHVLYSDIELTLMTEQFNTNEGYHVDSTEFLAGTSHIISNGYAEATAVVRSIE